MHWGLGRACRLLGYLRQIFGLPLSVVHAAVGNAPLYLLNLAFIFMVLVV